MTTTQLQQTTAPAPPQTKPKKPITAKQREIVELMIAGPAEGPQAGCALAMDEAARRAGVETRYVRKMLDKPHVRQFMNERKQVFRAAISLKNISRLAQIRDQDDNKMAAIQAIRTLEDVDEEAERRSTRRRTPGVAIMIVTNAPAGGASTTIDVQANDPGELSADSE